MIHYKQFQSYQNVYSNACKVEENSKFINFWTCKQQLFLLASIVFLKTVLLYQSRAPQSSKVFILRVVKKHNIVVMLLSVLHCSKNFTFRFSSCLSAMLPTLPFNDVSKPDLTRRVSFRTVSIFYKEVYT